MKMMKRVIAVILGVVMLVVCSVGAFAESLSGEAIKRRNHESTVG